MTVSGGTTARALARVVLLGLATWLALATVSNVCDGLVAAGVVPHLGFVSGNFVMARDTLARIAFPAWGAGAFLVLAIVLEAIACVAFARAFLDLSLARINQAFLVAILLFGGFVVVDEICTAYELEGIHRGIVVFIAALYLVVRATAAAD
jgi:hypothetical protein